MGNASEGSTDAAVDAGLLRDAASARRLAEVGCAHVGTVPGATVTATRARLEQLLPDGREGLHFSTQSSDPAYRSAVSSAIEQRLAPAVAQHLVGATFLFGVVVAQEPGEGMGVHQDITFVDDEAGRSVIAWVPLGDVDHATGTLSYLPASHHLVHGPRGTPTFPSPLRELDDALIGSRFVSIEAPAGAIIATDPRLTHRSTPNRTDRVRLAAVLAFVASDAALVHHHLRPDGLVERFRSTPAFYTRFDLEGPPRGLESLGTYQPRFDVVDRATFEATVGGGAHHR